jgi:hypothetical protein
MSAAGSVVPVDFLKGFDWFLAEGVLKVFVVDLFLTFGSPVQHVVFQPA